MKGAESIDFAPLNCNPHSGQENDSHFAVSGDFHAVYSADVSIVIEFV